MAVWAKGFVWVVGRFISSKVGINYLGDKSYVRF